MFLSSSFGSNDSDIGLQSVRYQIYSAYIFHKVSSLVDKNDLRRQ